MRGALRPLRTGELPEMVHATLGSGDVVVQVALGLIEELLERLLVTSGRQHVAHIVHAVEVVEEHLGLPRNTFAV
jgi:hypothetical protein